MEWYQEARLDSSKFLTLQEGTGDLCTMYKHWASDQPCQEKQPRKRLLHQVLQQLIAATCNNCITDGQVQRKAHSALLRHVLNNECCFPSLSLHIEKCYAKYTTDVTELSSCCGYPSLTRSNILLQKNRGITFLFISLPPTFPDSSCPHQTFYELNELTKQQKT